MRILLLCTLVLVACTTAPPSAPIYKPVMLTVDSSSSGALVLTRIAPLTPPATDSSLQASARFGGERLVLEFLSPLPTRAQQLVVGPEVSLGDVGFFCDVVPGSYDIAMVAPLGRGTPFSEERTGVSASAPRYGSVDLSLAAVSGHRPRPSRKGNGPVK